MNSSVSALGGIQFGELPENLLAIGNPINLPTPLEGSLWQKEALVKEGVRDLPSLIKNKPLVFRAARKALCLL